MVMAESNKFQKILIISVSELAVTKMLQYVGHGSAAIS